ncbi:uncharacterized protein LOC117110070 [Anneissia japonica]|uniref:uncharacterized protein LOC117110070 n=1 Tax=Anneissia japonica TaxID=1529436 RepID=UPI0014256231|nr:uncharacterized protein LOC117110070 [Anneissia japonica]
MKEMDIKFEYDRMEFEKWRMSKESELEEKKLKTSQSLNESYMEITGKAKVPKLSAFCESNDDIDSYINRFERYAKNQKWPENEWATNLSALLTGGALEVYSRLPNTDAENYQLLKCALLKRYDFTIEGFRSKCMSSKPNPGETGHQYATRLEHYLLRWVELEGIGESYVELKDLILRSQYIEGCPFGAFPKRAKVTYA